MGRDHAGHRWSVTGQYQSFGRSQKPYKQAKKRLADVVQEDTLHLFSMRLSATDRIDGIRNGRILKRLWYDPASWNKRRCSLSCPPMQKEMLSVRGCFPQVHASTDKVCTIISPVAMERKNVWKSGRSPCNRLEHPVNVGLESWRCLDGYMLGRGAEIVEWQG